MAYDPTTPSDPYDPATDSVKTYSSYPQYLRGGRITSNLGRQLIAENDPSVNGKTTPAPTKMIKHPH